MMNKISSFLKQINRGKHLIGGFIVSWGASSPYDAVYAAAVAASCLELKDKLRGGYWDWVDWSLMILGGILGAVCRYILGL